MRITYQGREHAWRRWDSPIFLNELSNETGMRRTLQRGEKATRAAKRITLFSESYGQDTESRDSSTGAKNVRRARSFVHSFSAVLSCPSIASRARYSSAARARVLPSSEPRAHLAVRYSRPTRHEKYRRARSTPSRRKARATFMSPTTSTPEFPFWLSTYQGPHTQR